MWFFIFITSQRFPSKLCRFKIWKLSEFFWTGSSYPILATSMKSQREFFFLKFSKKRITPPLENFIKYRNFTHFPQSFDHDRGPYMVNFRYFAQCSAPQRSILYPLLLLIYINDATIFTKHFAKDTGFLYISSGPKDTNKKINLI